MTQYWIFNHIVNYIYPYIPLEIRASSACKVNGLSKDLFWSKMRKCQKKKDEWEQRCQICEAFSVKTQEASSNSRLRTAVANALKKQKRLSKDGKKNEL